MGFHQVVGGAFSLLAIGSVGRVAYSAFTKSDIKSEQLIREEDSGNSDRLEDNLPEGNLQGEEPVDRQADAESLVQLGDSDKNELSDEDPHAGKKQTTYTFFFRGKKDVTVNIACFEGQAPNFDKLESNNKIYIGCAQEGNETKIDSGVLLGSKGTITCVAPASSNTFECSGDKSPVYTFGEKSGEEIVYIKEI
ncbi:hypothetical protein MHLP_01225 [Candidatus Mycoplasma haematolamae str. Purdue]|uniref:Uncharacterized protein n=1 Tax=Mycoplasma haematolamae (strain Purdue) TaxID=1212765 RepID=I7B973_MYCHA|nr:hypothetical protein [Candidatus Mycoplasma haematolamae]AFO51825.1 hypothetical protein MHLP_01225 [Candidatus Mycoplasma haematolamae str. Purdue]